MSLKQFAEKFYDVYFEYCLEIYGAIEVCSKMRNDGLYEYLDIMNIDIGKFVLHWNFIYQFSPVTIKTSEIGTQFIYRRKEIIAIIFGGVLKIRLF